MSDPDLLALLTPDRRLALAYAPRVSKPLFLGLFALDARMGTVVNSAREPILAQLKLAWWRDQLAKSIDQRPAGEPVLAALSPWGEASKALSVLADGWEYLLESDGSERDRSLGFVQARGQAMASLAGLVGCDPLAARQAGERWAWGDLFSTVASKADQEFILQIASEQLVKISGLNRNMRPLIILQRLAERSLARANPAQGLGGLLLAMRLGLIGV